MTRLSRAWFVVAAAVIGVLAAASLAHEVIDLAGDFLLPHDTYDGVVHDSRVLLASLAACLALCGALAYVVRLIDGGSRRGFDLRAHAAALNGWRLNIGAAIAGGTLLVVPVMELLDAHLAMRPVDDPSDAFGGSLLLGVACCVLTALVVAALLASFARFLTAHESDIAQVILRVLGYAAPIERRDPAARLRYAGAPAMLPQARLARRSAKRGPPVSP